jgi:hypothetical protein
MFDDQGNPIWSFTSEQWIAIRKYREISRMRISVYPPNHIYLGGKEVTVGYVQEYLKSEKDKTSFNVSPRLSWIPQ